MACCAAPRHGRSRHAARAVPAVAAGGETKVVHRIAVFESHGEITNVISQMDVMRSVGGEGRVGGGQVLGWWWGGWRGGWGRGLPVVSAGAWLGHAWPGFL